jgi:hypothetical protein
MDILDKLSENELTQTLIAELAKATNELACAKRDIDKAQSRLRFILVVAHEMINRKED